MKIFIIGQKGIPAVGGGVETHVDNLATKLVEFGHDIYVYTRHNYSDKKRKEYNGIKLIPLPSISSKNLDAISHTFLACLDFIIKRKADVVHFHSIGPSSLIWLVKIFKPRTKIVFTFHSKCYQNKKWGVLGKIYLILGEKMSCFLADEIIVVSRGLKKYVESKYNRKANYIPNGVNLPDKIKADEIIKKWGLKKNSYILSVSRLVKNKGIEYLIEAFKSIKTEKKLVIVGDGLYEKYLKDLAKGDDRIIFTGKQGGKILQELFSNTSLFVQSSEAEGLSISLLEAISYQIPILISDIEANVKVMGEDYFNFKNKNVEDLKSKLNLFISDKEGLALDKKIKMVYNRLLSEYNWDGVAKETFDVYKGY
jgi:glycosyltransferase involved in cell wall biosynthesis